MTDTIPAPNSGIAAANGVNLCYEMFGDPAAPPILLVMGLGAQMVMWDVPFCERLARRGFRVVRFDNRDAGKSTWFTGQPAPGLMDLVKAQLAGQPIVAPYALRDMAADATGLLAALGIARAHVVGASMGGAIAQEMAIHHPDRLLSLTSIMSSTGDPSLPPPTREAMMVLMTRPPASKAEYLSVFQRNWRVLRGGPAPADEVLDVERASLIYDRGLNPEGTARQLAAITLSGNRRPALAGVRVPTLVIHGRRDPLVPFEHGVDVAAAIPGAKFLALDDMGHAISTPFWDEIVGAIAGHANGADRP